MFRKAERATTVYRVIWAEFSEETRTVCIGREAAGWMKNLFNISDKGAIPIPSLQERE